MSAKANMAGAVATVPEFSLRPMIVQIRVAGDAIEPGEAINEETGAERAEDEVFHPGFEGADVAAHEGDHDVEADGDEFES